MYCGHLSHSLAQQESESLSANVRMGIQYRNQQGKVQINHNWFLGYTKDAEGNLVIDPEQAEIVRRIYREYLEGASFQQIKRSLEPVSCVSTYISRKIERIVIYGFLLMGATLLVGAIVMGVQAHGKSAENHSPAGSARGYLPPAQPESLPVKRRQGGHHQRNPCEAFQRINKYHAVERSSRRGIVVIKNRNLILILDKYPCHAS